MLSATLTLLLIGWLSSTAKVRPNHFLGDLIVYSFISGSLATSHTTQRVRQ
jgi:hypothetical protein